MLAPRRRAVAEAGRWLRAQELRVKGSYLHHKEVKAAQGIKIAAHGLESAVAGTQMLVVQPGDNLDLLKEEVMADMQDIFSSVARGGAHWERGAGLRV